MPYMPIEYIQSAVEAHFYEYYTRNGICRVAPIDVENILENSYGIIPVEEDLSFLETPESGEVLGMTQYINGKFSVKYDRKISPYLSGGNEQVMGRFRFTIAHELGHLCLHFPSEIQEANGNSFGEDDFSGEIVSVFRSGELRIRSRKSRKEWQADAFAVRLLMPEDTIRKEWVKLRGIDSDPEDVTEEMEALQKDAAYPDSVRPETARVMAAKFLVSAEAMMYRLEEIGLMITPRMRKTVCFEVKK